jgi:DNA-binding response OmpR family regulator
MTGWGRGRPMRLLLIEDDGNVAEILVATFMDEGHQTTVRHTSEAGLSYLESTR